MIIIDKKSLSALVEKASSTKRKRLNYNFHSTDADTLQRLLNAIEPDTYVQPHKHENPDKREVFIIIQGIAAIICFDDEGDIIEYSLLNRDEHVYAVEIPPRVWHTLVSLKEGTVLYEIKDGPFDANNDKKFAPWAPAEGDSLCELYLKNLKKRIKL